MYSLISKKIVNDISKQFKGCLKIPLDTTKTLSELLTASTAYQDWKYKKRIILDSKRHYTLNFYMINILGELEIITTQSNTKINSRELRDLIEFSFKKYVYTYPMLDYNQSYVTISC